MSQSLTVSLFLLLVFVYVEGFFQIKFRQFPIPEGDDPGKPLYLSPLIEKGKIAKAQRLSRVNPAIGDTASYSGYLTTDKACGNNLFFWFFPSQQDWEAAPLVLWLQGGPGSPSMFGLFEELGPFNSFPDGLKKREYSWNVKHNLLFIDQPVGTGYSFTDRECYADNQTAVGDNLYSALVQFLELFPNLQKNKFFITGESYAGHYIPAIGHAIHKNNPSARLKINLAGMMIGDGWTDPVRQVDYGDYLYEAGLVDDAERKKLSHYQDLFVSQVTSQDWSEAAITLSTIHGLVVQYTGVSVYNYLPQPADKSDWDRFIQLTATRRAIHVGGQVFSDGAEVSAHLFMDVAKSVKPWVEELLEHYPIVYYAGQVDIICAYPMVVNFLRSLQWSGQQHYLSAPRKHWYEGQQLAGYIKGEGHLFDVLVRAAGHMVPTDQPFWASQLLDHFTATEGIFAGVDKPDKT